MFRRTRRANVCIAAVIAMTALPIAATRATGAETQVPAIITFDDSHLSHPVAYYGYHGFTVFDSAGAPVRGSLLPWTATVTGPNGPQTVSGQLDWYGRGVFGYYAQQVGVDVLTVIVGAAVGDATREYGLRAPLAVSDQVPVRVEFDEEHTYRPTHSYGYHGFTVYDAQGDPVVGKYMSWIAVMAGANGPYERVGMIDYFGRGVFGYEAGHSPGTDVLSVTVNYNNARIVGSATRSYGSEATMPEAPTPALPGPTRTLLDEYRFHDQYGNDGVDDDFHRIAENVCFTDATRSTLKYCSWGIEGGNEWQSMRIAEDEKKPMFGGTYGKDAGIGKMFPTRAGEHYGAVAWVRIEDYSTDHFKPRVTIAGWNPNAADDDAKQTTECNKPIPVPYPQNDADDTVTQPKPVFVPVVIADCAMPLNKTTPEVHIKVRASIADASSYGTVVLDRVKFVHCGPSPCDPTFLLPVKT